ncbi:MAG: molybdopterin-dependent oxidoreductase [Candidatus Lokiarchaeota archaeon]|nr:molybdopterin-dependent oxidoreductase [Candidatus Lokiarchaeota archaeon]
MNRIKKPSMKFTGIFILLCIPLIALTALLISRNMTTPNDDFFVITKGEIPELNTNSWTLIIDGHVNKSLTFSYSNFTSQPSKEVRGTLQCVEGPSGTAIWKGVPIKALLNMTQLKTGAVDVVFYAADDYSSSLTIEEVNDDNALLAYKMNGEPLPVEQGFPVRVVAPNQLGYKWVKWVVRIEIVNYDYIGYWESQGWSDNATRTQLTNWFLHAFLLSVAFLFGGIAMISGLKRSPVTELFHDLPKFVNKKFHITFSIAYFLTSLSAFIYWMISTILNRGAIFFTVHGILALLAIIFLIPGVITGLKKSRIRDQKTRTWHYKWNIYSFIFFTSTIILGFYLAFTGQFRFF